MHNLYIFDHIMKITNVIDQLISRANKIKFSEEKNSVFRTAAYFKVINAIKKTYKDELSSAMTSKKILQLPITDHMKTIIGTIVSTPLAKKDNDVSQNFMSIIGIGKKKATELIKLGATSASDLRKNKYKKLLNDDTKMYLKHKPIRKIPYAHINKIEPILLKIIPDKTVIVGSYRRKSLYSKDIDIMIVSENKNIINDFVENLSREFKGVYVYNNGNDKASLFLDATNIIGKRAVYKVDIFRTHPDYEIPMLLYSTGSKENNIYMRKIANRKHLTLNQKGLYKLKKRINLLNEKSYYDYLEIPYLRPEHR